MTSVDYLIVGAGSRGLAFADALLKDRTVRVAIIDRHSHPGGMWNRTYDYARAQPPANAFGVNSHALSDWLDTQAATPANSRFDARRDDVLKYFRAIMHEHLLPTGQVLFFPEHVGMGGERIYCRKTDSVNQIHVRAKIVDATHPQNPVRRPESRCFSSAPGVDVITPHDLSARRTIGADLAPHYCIIGAGKTAMDVALYLLQSGIKADRLSWVKPRDAWLIAREALQFRPARINRVLQRRRAAYAGLEHAITAKEVCEHLESTGFLTRIYANHTPTMFHEAIASVPEIKALQQIQHVIRKGHVHGISTLGMILDDGAQPMPRRTVYIDCTASSVQRRAGVPIFNGNQIRLQNIRMCQPCLSAAMIARIELLKQPEQAKNALCSPLLTPDSTHDLIAQLLGNLKNCEAWFAHAELRSALKDCRLDGVTGLAARALDHPGETSENVSALRRSTPRVLDNLQMILDQVMAQSR